MSRPFKFEHGTRRGKAKPTVDNTSIIVMRVVRPRKSRARLTSGRRIRTMGALVKYLNTHPSVWYATAGKPMPSTVLLNWQLRWVDQYLRSGRFYTVKTK